VSTPNVIVGTAGHIDHGKTSLVRRLTGVDTDRLPEEKRRGITIVLGFAPLILDDGRRVGVVDVPGHERFVKNMVAGAGGIDVVLMVVAADEGVMPQTREHLEICELLGIPRGLVALTKIDRAPELAELAVEDVRAEFAGSFLAAAPIIPCSSETGEGIDRLRAELTALVKEVPPRAQKSLLLPIDRRFSVKGFGTIVTGTLIQGQLAVGDTVEVLPELPGHRIDDVRVRSIQVFSDPVERAFAGQRTAINLQGVDLEKLALGQVVVARGTARPTQKVGVQLRYLESWSKKLKTGAKFLFHTGTALVEAALTLLDADALEPGGSGYATIRLAEPIATLPGQRFIARGFDTPMKAGRTIAGGTIIDTDPGRRRRKTEDTVDSMSKLHALVEKGPDEGRLEAALVKLVAEKKKRGIVLGDLSLRLGFNAARIEKTAKQAERIFVIGDRAIHEAALRELMQRMLDAVAAYHREFPFRKGVAIAELSTRVAPALDPRIAELAAKKLVGEKRLVQEQEGLRVPSHAPAAETNTEAKEKLIAALDAGGYEPPAPADLETVCGLRGATFKELIAALVRSGEIVSAAPTIYFSKRVWNEATTKVLVHIEKEGEISTAQAKTLFGISRKFLIPLLEAMDKHRITVRVGEVRKARPGVKI
jgi:selenocysteine-specific elongation factor